MIAKHADSQYKSGKRTPDWRKVKIVREQEFVIGGWTEPRQTRTYFGALLLGVYQGSGVTNQRGAGSGKLVYVGHVGTGFNERELARLMKLLKPIETKDCPFHERPVSNERPHWVKPKLVAQVRFTEWTDDNRLRHPVYLGLRDDKKPEDVVREEVMRLSNAPRSRRGSSGGPPTRAVGRADKATYTATTGDVELRGTPRVQEGPNMHVATSPDTVMIINQNSQLTTHGPSRTEIRQEPKEDQTKEKKGEAKKAEAQPAPSQSVPAAALPTP